MKLKKFFKKYNLWIIISIVLILTPILILTAMYKSNLLSKANSAEITAGCLGYYGTIILGIVAVVQTHILLNQNAETFISEKYALIKILRNCSFKIIDNTLLLYENIHKFPVNQYYVGLNNDFRFDTKLKLLKLTMFYNTGNIPINELVLNYIKFNYQDHFHVDHSVKTSICENLMNNCGQIDIVFRLPNEELKMFQNALNEGTFILSLNFEVNSGFNVKMKEEVEINLENLTGEVEKFKFSREEKKWKIATTSYNYKKGGD